jgi:starch synthase
MQLAKRRRARTIDPTSGGLLDPTDPTDGLDQGDPDSGHERPTSLHVPADGNAFGRTLRVVHVAAECWPFARTGGLGEAVAGLARAQQVARRSVRVVLPLYAQVRTSLAHARCDWLPPNDGFVVSPPDGAAPLAFGRTARARPGRTVSATDRAIQSLCQAMLFIESDAAFARPGIYGEGGRDYTDNAMRFSILGLAAVAAIRHAQAAGDLRTVILHAHDWHGAYAVLALRQAQRQLPALQAVGTVLTVHNAAYQGHGGATAPLVWPWPDPEIVGVDSRTSPLEAALRLADVVTTVSPTHAAELRTKEGGFGLDEWFRALGERFTGIRNGLDVAMWRPADANAGHRRSPRSDIAERAAAKTALQRRLGLNVDARLPLLAVCSRLCAQKGVDLILDAGLALRHDLQLVVLGEGDPHLARALEQAAAAAPGRLAFQTPFEDDEERLLLQGADLLLMPSRFEPCGLAQLRAQHFGVVPVAHAVGGLLDTIRDGDTGFLFAPHSPEALRRAVDRALAVHRDSLAWARLVHRCRNSDVGWSASVRAYDRAYASATARAARRAVEHDPGVLG